VNIRQSGVLLHIANFGAGKFSSCENSALVIDCGRSIYILKEAKRVDIMISSNNATMNSAYS
jgi:hypothetical protein